MNCPSKQTIKGKDFEMITQNESPIDYYTIFTLKIHLDINFCDCYYPGVTFGVSTNF
ncbi:MAG: hypothetical protein LBG80_00015 [Bacteroidales bacterium]|nr:hypothetical protein [Bacteroidales bacterium]